MEYNIVLVMECACCGENTILDKETEWLESYECQSLH